MNTSEKGSTFLPAGATDEASPGRRRSAPDGLEPAAPNLLAQVWTGDRGEASREPRPARPREPREVGSVGASVWPYPRWIAHRGAGKLAPENTLAAFKLGASHGYRMFECDVKLSADGMPFLLHDATLERTTSGQGIAGNLAWAELSTLDAGSSHSETFAAEPLPALETIAAYCLEHRYFLNIEIKPTPGRDAITGSAVAQAAAKWWPADAVPPLLTSFSPEALEAAEAAQPQLPRGLLLDTLWTGWLETALGLGCAAVICNHTLWDESSMLQAKSAGFRCLSYTVNDAAVALRLMALGTDGIITDRVDFFDAAL
jgi:glycerophosphoryl diester phosphodiesterase